MFEFAKKVGKVKKEIDKKFNLPKQIESLSQVSSKIRKEEVTEIEAISTPEPPKILTFDSLGIENNVYSAMQEVLLKMKEVRSGIFDIKIVPTDLPIKRLTLTETIVEGDNEEIQRRDFIMFPMHAVRKLSDGRIGILMEPVRRLDDMIHFFRYYEHNNETFERYGHIERILTVGKDTWEIYTVGGKEMLEVQTPTVCHRCEVCNEMKPEYDVRNSGCFSQTMHEKSTENRESRVFVLHQPLLAFFFKMQICIAEIQHPCRERSLQDLIEVNKRSITADPPEIKLIFPKTI